jgi:hypothetical protein
MAFFIFNNIPASLVQKMILPVYPLLPETGLVETRCHLPLRLDDDSCCLPQERAERHFRRQERMSQTGHCARGSIQQRHQQAPAEARAIPRAQRIHRPCPARCGPSLSSRRSRAPVHHRRRPFAGLRSLLRGGGHACTFRVSSFQFRVLQAEPESGWATCAATRRLLTSQYQMIIYHVDTA